MDLVVIIDILCTTVNAGASNEEGVPVLLTLQVHHLQLLIQLICIVTNNALILHAARSFIHLRRINALHHFLLGEAFVVDRLDLLRLPQVALIVITWRTDIRQILHLMDAIKAVAVEVV